MNDFEFFGTIGAFIAGFVLLIYLFRVRHVVMRRIKMRMLQAKAKIHYATRPKANTHWDTAATRKREIC